MPKLTKPEKLKKFKRLFEESVSADVEWQKAAQTAYAYKAGDQWTAQERKYLEDKNRPCLTFNLIKPTIDLLMGVAEQNRVRLTPEPVEKNDQFLCDVLEAAIDWVDERSDAETEEDEACEDSWTSGRGFVGVDVAPDPERPLEIIMSETSIPVHEVRLDPAGTRNDLKDHRHIFREKWISREDFRRDYPEFAKDIDEIFDRPDYLSTEGGRPYNDDIWDAHDPDDDDSDYERPLDTNYYDRKKDLVRVIHCEYWDSYKRFYGFNPKSGEVEEFDGKMLSTLKARLDNFEYEVVWDKKVKWFQFVGDKILYDGDSPIPYPGFSIVPIFAYKDKSSKGVRHFGLVRGMQDPQTEVNKRISQTLWLIQTQGSGVMAEADAFLDLQQAEDSWNDPSQITFLNKGALQQGKVQEKPGLVLSTGLLQLSETMQDIMKKISGVNPDLLGQDRGRQEPGVVVRMRQQQGLTILAGLFRNFKRMRKEVFKRKMAVVQKYMPDSQLTRILGQNEDYVIRQGVIVDKKRGFLAPIRNVRDIEYNVKIEEGPNNLTKLMSELAIFLDMMSKNFPVDPKVVIERLDLSAGDKAQWQEYIDGKMKEAAETSKLAFQAKVKAKEADLALQEKKIQADTQAKVMQLQQKEQESQRDHAVDIAKLDQEDQKLVMSMVEQLSKKSTTTQEARNG